MANVEESEKKKEWQNIRIVVRVLTFGRSRIRIVRALFGRSRISNSWAAANNEYQKIRVFDIPEPTGKNYELLNEGSKPMEKS